MDELGIITPAPSSKKEDHFLVNDTRVRRVINSVHMHSAVGRCLGRWDEQMGREGEDEVAPRLVRRSIAHRS